MTADHTRKRPRRRSRQGWAMAMLLLAVALMGACTQDGPGAGGDAATGPGPAIPDPQENAAGTTPTEAAPSAGTDVATDAGDPGPLDLELVVDGLSAPLWAGSPPGDDRLVVAQQNGLVLVVEADGTLRSDPVLDLRDRVLAGGERGLLALAFAPDFATSGLVVAHSSAEPDGRTRLEARRLDPAALTDTGEARTLLEVPQPAANHNGGTVAFGPDGMLWLALGDGGGAGDQFGQAQRPDTLLGALVRIDVQPLGSDPGYAIPADNPDPSGADGAPEVWATGVRNPWRVAFDGDLLIVADVGQDHLEEISVVPVTAAGANFGWPLKEGTACFSGGCGDGLDLVEPVAEYDHDDGCSIIGGVVYRGDAIPGLQGHYLYSDLCTGFLRSVVLDADGAATASMDLTAQVGGLGQVLSFGTDAAGEALVLTADGQIRRIVPA